MTDMTERVDRLDAMIAEGRVLREQWTDGHERACLLAAISPEAGRAGYASACPAHVMPAWLAYMTPWIDDEASDESWPHIVRRYAALARRWHALDGAAWERARIASHIAIVSEARLYCRPSEKRALAAIDGVLAWLRRGAPGSERAAVAMTAAASSRAAVASSRAASRAAEAAAAARAAEATAEAAAWAAEAASRAARGSAASDRIATAVLNAIEAEIERDE